MKQALPSGTWNNGPNIAGFLTSLDTLSQRDPSCQFFCGADQLPPPRQSHQHVQVTTLSCGCFARTATLSPTTAPVVSPLMWREYRRPRGSNIDGRTTRHAGACESASWCSPALGSATIWPTKQRRLASLCWTSARTARVARLRTTACAPLSPAGRVWLGNQNPPSSARSRSAGVTSPDKPERSANETRLPSSRPCDSASRNHYGAKPASPWGPRTGGDRDRDRVRQAGRSISGRRRAAIFTAWWLRPRPENSISSAPSGVCGMRPPDHSRGPDFGRR